MNIGIDIRPLMEENRTGVGEYTYEMLNALFKIDSHNQYFLFYNSRKDVAKNIPRWTQDNVHYVGFHWPNKLLNLCLLIFGRPKIDKLIGQRLDYFFSPNLNFCALSKNVKHILTIHDLSFEFFPDCFDSKRRLWHKILSPKNSCRKAQIILVPSENTKNDLIDRYNVDNGKVKIIYPGLSSVFFEQNLCSAEEIRKKYNLPKRFILFLGTIEPRKNISGAVEAFKKIRGFFPDYKLIVAGGKGWKYKLIMGLIEKENGVQYIGYVDAKDKPALYSLADLFVYPSLYEGFGFPVLEAMSAGVPVLTSRVAAMLEVAEDGAYLVNPNNISEIAQGMKLLLENKKLAAILQEKGKKRAKEFAWARAAEEFLKIM